MGIPEDTSKRDPAVHLLGALSDGTSAYIEGMEAAGQRQLVASTVLPIDTRGRDADFEALGFTFGEKTDDLFRDAILPEGWSKQGSDHAMWSYIVDERGVERAAIFYKAAFYDRSAHMDLSHPGRSLASKALYDETTEVPWDVLTEDERSDFLASVRGRLKDAEESPGFYGKYVPTAEALLARYGGES